MNINDRASMRHARGLAKLLTGGQLHLPARAPQTERSTSNGSGADNREKLARKPERHTDGGADRHDLHLLPGTIRQEPDAEQTGTGRNRPPAPQHESRRRRIAHASKYRQRSARED